MICFYEKCCRIDTRVSCDVDSFMYIALLLSLHSSKKDWNCFAFQMGKKSRLDVKNWESRPNYRASLAIRSLSLSLIPQWLGIHINFIRLPSLMNWLINLNWLLNFICKMRDLSTKTNILKRLQHRLGIRKDCYFFMPLLLLWWLLG